jgi:hypothetical protein
VRSSTLSRPGPSKLVPVWDESRRRHRRQWARRWWAFTLVAGVAVITTTILLVVLTLDRGLTSTEVSVLTHQIRPAVAQFLNLQQSVLVPTGFGSLSWPSTVPQGPLLAGTHVTAPTVDAAEAASMVAAATKVFASRETRAARRKFDYWIEGAIEDRPARTVSAGVRIVSFDITALTPTSATVVARISEWQQSVSSGRTVMHPLVVRGRAELSLVRYRSRWLVSDFLVTSPF